MTDFKNRRKHKRISGLFKATFIPDPSEPLMRFSCNSKDISEGGMRVTTQREPIAGSDVLVVFELKKGDESLSIPAAIIPNQGLESSSAFNLIRL